MKLFRQSVSSTAARFLLVITAICSSAGADLVDNTLETGENLFQDEPLLILGVGTAGALTSYLLESDTSYGGFLPESPFSTLDKCDDFLFGPVLPASAACIWLSGTISGNETMENTGEDLCRGLLYSYGLTTVLKYTWQRERPDCSNNLSMPSGHAAGSSCTAAVLWADHGSSVGIPAAVIALYTCISRVNLEKHFPSDVILGAAIGTACGIAASQVGNSPAEGLKQTGISFTIAVDSQGRIYPSIW